jgi:hypothetical protein
MNARDSILKRFTELETQMSRIRRGQSEMGPYVEGEDFQRWATSAQNIIKIAFGENSPHFKNFSKAYEGFNGYVDHFEYARGVFSSAKSDFEAGFATTLEALVSGEIFGDFIGAAKNALAEGNKDVAAVLACAALEDALKRFANSNGLAVDGKDMSEVIGTLKSKGLVGGSQKSILETMPKTRNAAMHADWPKISPTEVGGVIGFTEQFLLQNFS